MRSEVRILPLALLLLAVPARAQSHSRESSYGETHIVETNAGRELELRSRGRVEFDDEGEWVTALGPGATLMVREETNGGDRRLDFDEADDGGVRVRYRVDGALRPLDAGAREWARRVLRQATHESGLGAQARVDRIRQRSGVGGVLADMAGLRTDTGRRIYYGALLQSGPMSDADFARVMDDAGARIRSSTDLRLVLSDAAERAPSGRGIEALLRAAAHIDSDTDARLVLSRVAERQRLGDPGVRDAFFRAVEGVGSDTDARLILSSVLEHNALDAGMRPGFFRAVASIQSDTDRRLVLSQALERGASEAVAVDALQAAEALGSDTEKRLVLSQVPGSLHRSTRVIEAYRRVVDRMHDDTERRLALTWLLQEDR